MDKLKAPFPWFGGKSTVAKEVWKRLGDVPNFIEPFFGSGAVLLARPGGAGHTETVNDLDGFVANFWRAVKHNPEAVAAWIDYPVIERDLEARHHWLLTEGRARVEALRGEAEGYDAQVAGWWCWGLCCWIGSGWCSGEGPWVWDGAAWVNRRESDGTAGMGVNRKLPHLGGGHGGGAKGVLSDGVAGIERKRPHIATYGKGINRQRPHLGDAGMGINRQRPHLGSAGPGVGVFSPGCSNGGAADLIRALSARLARVRVCSGDWSRVCGPSVTSNHGVTGVFLDPPYSDEAGRTADLYATDSGEVAKVCAAWAREAGANRLMRIAFCGYKGEHEFPGWTAWSWKAQGGYGSQGVERGRENAKRETIWFSPHCEREAATLFDMTRPAS